MEKKSLSEEHIVYFRIIFVIEFEKSYWEYQKPLVAPYLTPPEALREIKDRKWEMED